ncbi:MAG: hypothetical protein K9G76_07840 [Bacteroidales bacterium]|nr:hypothetical protein [Bacteroidales bacterium]MCF8404762.1 hypothetical protein [Bacteroidales bacterium]
MSNSDLNPGNLNALKFKLRKRFPQLTEVDMSSQSGNVNILLSLVAYKLRMTKAEIREIIIGL